jgi:hypothetical protein
MRTRRVSGAVSLAVALALLVPEAVSRSAADGCPVTATAHGPRVRLRAGGVKGFTQPVVIRAQRARYM